MSLTSRIKTIERQAAELPGQHPALDLSKLSPEQRGAFLECLKALVGDGGEVNNPTAPVDLSKLSANQRRVFEEWLAIIFADDTAGNVR